MWPDGDERKVESLARSMPRLLYCALCSSIFSCTAKTKKKFGGTGTSSQAVNLVAIKVP